MNRLCLVLFLVAQAATAADPPFVKLPPIINVPEGGFFVITAETNGKTVRWVPQTAGLSMIPVELLKDSKTAVCMAAKGQYKMLAYTALGDEPSLPEVTTINVGAGVVTPPPIDPPPVDPDKPPTTGTVYFMLVRPDGPAHPQFTAIASMPAWAELRTKGFEAKDKELAAARALGIDIPPGTMLPCVITLRVSPDKKKSTVIPPIRALPTTNAAILALAEGL